MNENENLGMPGQPVEPPLNPQPQEAPAASPITTEPAKPARCGRKILWIALAAVVIVAAIIFFTGVILHVLKRQHADNLQHHLILLNELNKED